MSRAKRKRKSDASNRKIANKRKVFRALLKRIGAPSWLDLGLEQLHKFSYSAARGETDTAALAALTAAIVYPAIDGLVPPPTVAQIQAVRSGHFPDPEPEPRDEKEDGLDGRRCKLCGAEEWGIGNNSGECKKDILGFHDWEMAKVFASRIRAKRRASEKR